MEIQPAENRTLDALIANWSTHPDDELEATFGEKGAVDSTTFLGIAKRLAAKGYQARPQEDKLNILLPNKIRITLNGLGIIQQYCKDDKLIGKPFTAMTKDTTRAEANLFLPEYETKIKSRREKTLAQDDFNIKQVIDNWNTQKKAFRLIKRWSFTGHGIQIDMSIVRMTPRDSRGEFQWVRGFTEQDVFRQPPVYEVEVELKRGEETNEPEKAKKSLVRGIGEILRSIQKNTLLIRKSVRTDVLRQYQALVRSDRFRGVPPVTLERKNMAALDEDSVEIQDKTPNIRFGYNVTDKADGLRVMPFVDTEGNLYMIDMGLNVYRTGLRNGACRGSLLDGEWVTQTRNGKPVNLLLLFDIYYTTAGGAGSRDVSVLPFADLDNADTETRYNTLMNWMKTWKENEAVTTKSIAETSKLIVGVKTFRFSRGVPPPVAAGAAATATASAATRYDYNSIFEACSQTLDMPVIYHTDGLILTPNSAPLPSRPGETFFQQFKWKPASMNTVDFLVTLEKDPEIPSLDMTTTGIHPRTGETVRYKSLRLFVGSSKDAAYEDPRSTILNELPIPDAPNRRGPGAAPIRYKPTLFSPVEYPDTMASISNRLIELDATTGEEFITTEEGEAIHDRTIVEMRYDPAQPQGWRWIPMRIRHDKTERLMRGTLERTLNSEKVAESVWNSIHEPVTEYMVRTGSEEPSEEELRAMSEARGETRADISLKYYDRKASTEDLMVVRGLRDFHNRYIKEEILYKAILKRRGAKLIDYTCGKAADLQKWRRGRAGFVLGLDLAGESIRNKTDGAYRRYLDTMVNAGGRDRIAQMVFAIADSSLDIVSGAGGATQEESDILRAIFGRAQTEGALPKYVSKELAGKLRRGADAGVLMFSLHYFFQSKEALDGLLSNLAATIKEGGYFAGCCFDGESVFNFLSGVGNGGSRVGRDGDEILWSIVKKYDVPELADDDTSVGMAVDVEFITIGTPHTEYLVNFKYLTKRLADIGFELLTEAELAELGLRNSTSLFSDSYKMAEERGRKYPMTDDVKTFSFLNRWFIFRKRGADVAAAASAVTATATVARALEAAATTAAAAATEREDVVLTETVPATSIASSLLAREGPAGAVAATAQASQSTAGDEGIIIPAGAAAAAAAAVATKGPYIPLDTSAKYPISRVFLFYLSADKKSLYGDPAPAQWLAPGSLFPIQDPARPDVIYPSTEHFLAAMFYRHGTDKPDLAFTLFSSTGTIYQAFLAETMGKAEDAKYAAQIEMATKIRAMWYNPTTRKRTFNSYKVKTFNEAAWTIEKDKAIEYAMRQRWEKDARFHRIVESAREDGKYLLFYVASGMDELGGRRDREGHIVGENKIGRAIMKLANY
jgi:hypothetical protein